MILQYKNYEVEIVDDKDYTLNSSDNINRYDYQYYDDKYEYRFVSKHGIRIKSNGIEIASAIVFGTGGFTTTHEHSLIIKTDALLICCGNGVYSLEIPTLKLNWYKKFDTATCFEIYEFENDYIVHGECEITRLTDDGNIKWQFSGMDIFVTPNGSEAFEIDGNYIKLIDFQGYQYILDAEGNMIE